MQHHLGGNVVHSPIKPLTKEEMVPFIESVLDHSLLLEDLEREIESRLTVDDDFIRRVVAALMESTADPQVVRTPQYSSLSDRVCWKHGHQGWCAKMHALERYTRYCINYHHARKRVRTSEGSDHRFESNKYMKMLCFYGELKSQSRLQYYGADCNCGGLCIASNSNP